MCASYFDEEKVSHDYPLTTGGRRYVMGFLETHPNSWTTHNRNGSASFDASLDWDKNFDMGKYDSILEVHVAAQELVEVLDDLKNHREEYKALGLDPGNYERDRACLVGLMRVFTKANLWDAKRKAAAKV